MSTASGHEAVIEIRMEQLKAAILERDWKSVEFQYDRVLRAIQKKERAVKMEVWGIAVTSYFAARTLDEQDHINQVRAVTLARSRYTAARAFAEAGLYPDASIANRHIGAYGSTSTNEHELKVCLVEGEVFVSKLDSKSGDPYLRWSEKS